MEKQKGIVTYFNDAKGYGFIQQEDKREPVFVHYSAIMCDGFKTLTEGDVVYFEPHQTKSGMSALNVMRAKDAR